MSARLAVSSTSEVRLQGQQAHRSQPLMAPKPRGRGRRTCLTEDGCFWSSAKLLHDQRAKLGAQGFAVRRRLHTCREKRLAFEPRFQLASYPAASERRAAVSDCERCLDCAADWVELAALFRSAARFFFFFTWSVRVEAPVIAEPRHSGRAVFWGHLTKGPGNRWT